MDERRHVWEDVITSEVRAVAGNYSSRMGLGQRPALLCIDNYNAVFGDRREPLLEAMKRFPSTCGERAWDAIDPTLRLMNAARNKGIPVFHTTRDDHNRLVAGIGSTKRFRYADGDTEWSHAFFPQLAPLDSEYVVHKTRASAFYGTPLHTCLVKLGIDSLILCGNSTSGCVRATCVDAFMRGYAVAVAEECVFDRNWLSHQVNLFDMNTKYADVMFVDELIAILT